MGGSSRQPSIQADHNDVGVAAAWTARLAGVGFNERANIKMSAGSEPSGEGDHGIHKSRTKTLVNLTHIHIYK